MIASFPGPRFSPLHEGKAESLVSKVMRLTYITTYDQGFIQDYMLDHSGS